MSEELAQQLDASTHIARRLDSLALMAGAALHFGACYIRDSDGKVYMSNDTTATEPAVLDGATGASETETREAARLATLARYPVGSVWRYMGQVRHIRAVVDDLQFVYRVWNKHRGAWDYDIVYWHMLYLEMQEQAR